jgi:hypothetical protein
MVTCGAADQRKLIGDAGALQEPLAAATAKPPQRPNPHADGHTPSRQQRRHDGRHQPQSLHHNAAETAAATSAEEKTRRPTPGPAKIEEGELLKTTAVPRPR